MASSLEYKLIGNLGQGQVGNSDSTYESFERIVGCVQLVQAMSELDVSLDKLRINLNQFFKFGHRSFEVAQQDINSGLAIDSL